MPMHESLTAKVSLIVEIDGHRLVFEEDIRRIAGVRYHGADPRQTGYSTSDTLESESRRLVHNATQKAAARSTEFLRRAYPIHTDREDTQ